MKHGLDDTLFYYPFTEFTHIMALFPHLSSLILISYNNQDHPRGPKPTYYSCPPSICRDLSKKLFEKMESVGAGVEVEEAGNSFKIVKIESDA